eukprot:evm.model.scf_882.5 EVM.evm.TU.scf_882.5   scf_882:18796-20208(+)
MALRWRGQQMRAPCGAKSTARWPHCDLTSRPRANPAAIFAAAHHRRERSHNATTIGARLILCLAASEGSAAGPIPGGDEAEQSVGVVRLPPNDPGAGAEVFLFGVEHAVGSVGAAALGRFILERRPAEVVVETAVSTDHGSRTGNVVRAIDGMARDAARTAPMLASCCGVAMRLRQVGERATLNVLERLGRDLYGEQLAYTAAFAADAQVVFGDRPKAETWRRLSAAATVPDLDDYYAGAVELNYRGVLEPGAPRVRELDAAAVSTVERVLLLERDAVMCGSLAAASARVGAGGCVCGVVGLDHLEAVAGLWASGGSDDVLSSAEPAGEEEEPGSRRWCDGVKRGIMENAVGLGALEGVLQDLRTTLGPVADDQLEAYTLTEEIYASQRMQLACLPRDLLESVCGGREVSMWSTLEPLRRLRPVNGGPGYDAGVAEDLRMLNFEVGQYPADSDAGGSLAPPASACFSSCP